MNIVVGLAIGLVVTVSQSPGQGSIDFSNLRGGVNAPVTDGIRGGAITSANYVADLYYSTSTDATTDSFVPAHFNQPFSTLTLNGGGYFLGGSKTLTNIPGGTTILAQVRVWDSTVAPTFEEAAATDEVGYSQPGLLLVLGTPPAPATAMVGLQGFSLLIDQYRYGPSIDHQPVTQNALIGATVLLGVRASQRPPFPSSVFFQWYFNLTNPLPAATNAVLRLTNVQPAQSGGYHVIVHSLAGDTYSRVVNLNVVPALNATLLPVVGIKAVPGSSNVLQYAKGVNAGSGWFNLATLVVTNTDQIHIDTSATNDAARFYRLVQRP